MIRRPPRSTLFPTRRSSDLPHVRHPGGAAVRGAREVDVGHEALAGPVVLDRKSTRLNSSHGYISYAVFCLKKKKTNEQAFYAHITRLSTTDVVVCLRRYLIE